MSRQKRSPPLSKILSAAITELSEVFGIDSICSRKFVESIRKNKKVLVMLELDQKRRTLIWTKERRKWKLILLSPEGGPRDRVRFNEWKGRPAALMLSRWGIYLGHAPHGEVIEFEWGVDDDMIVTDHKKQ
ncbi:MAG: hypothetical protein KJI72_01320 [Patescibacteria group bacterium]|nr:hypothetical protein [Patescibacteria group bacterium]